MGGPVSSGYPGTPFMVLFAGFAAFLLGRMIWLGRTARRSPAGRSDWRGYVSVAIVAGSLLGWAVWAIWAHR
jgi:hypothetical protein